MFSKIRNFGQSLIKNNRYWFGPKRALKQRVRAQLKNPETQKKSKQFSHIQIGLYGLVFACCFAALPLYRTFCEHVGLVGNNDKKVYQFKQKKVVNIKKYIVKFKGMPQPGINWQFQPVEKEVILGASQTAIIFYKLRNKENRPIVGFSTYNIHPEQANIYFSKIQCFCFNQQLINPEQQLLLPLFFYLQPQINDDLDVSRIRQISVNYQFYQSANQDLAKFAAQQIERVEDNKRKLMEIRAKKNNMSIEQYKQYLQEKEEKQEDQPLMIDAQQIKARVDAQNNQSLSKNINKK